MSSLYQTAMYALSDKRAVVYSKNALDRGDTLVILHPNDYKPRDPSGFALNRDVRVHSRKLISTDSEKFEKIFSPNVQRAARQCHYPDGLPHGIDYILDLRNVAAMNLEEGPVSEDMTQQLISELKCSRGIRCWSKSQSRCGIPHDLVSGIDAVAAFNQETPTTCSPIPPPKPSPSLCQDYQIPKFTGHEKYDHFFQNDMLEALKISAEEQAYTRWDDDNVAGYQAESDWKEEDVLEYCPVRYRIAIEHLLQIIEGKEPTWLDSAPKVWTLHVVAKYFGCTRYVTDRIFAWMFAPRNLIFIESLPEVSMKMGCGMQNSLITRPAFAILVSEEALRIASSDNPSIKIPRGVLDNVETRFLRRRESLDGVDMQCIERAGEQLYDRVKRQWEHLADPIMAWLGDLPEWEKIHRLKRHIKSLDDKDLIRKTDQIIEDLDKLLTDYVRGPLIRSLYESIPSASITLVNNHRRLQQYLSPYLADFKGIYDRFTNSERIMTRYFWQILSKLIWRPTKVWNFDALNDDHPIETNPFIGRDVWIEREHGIRKIETAIVAEKIDELNVAVYEAGFAKVPSPYAGFHLENSKLLFSLSDFLTQVNAYIQPICQMMLDKGDMDWATTTDTLLCLSEAEYACLPDWEKEVATEKPEKMKEKCELTDMSDWEGAEEGSMSEWDLLDD